MDTTHNESCYNVGLLPSDICSSSCSSSLYKSSLDCDKLGPDGVYSGVATTQLEECSYRCYCRHCFTHLVNKLAGKIRADSVQPPQVPAASFLRLMSINIAHYSNEMNGILSDSECWVAVLFWPIVNVATLPWNLRLQWLRLKECCLV